MSTILSAAPDERLDPAEVYVADLRQPGPEGSYAVRVMARATFDARATASRATAAAEPTEAAPGESAGAAEGSPNAAAPNPDADVVIYGASWCGACRSAEAFLRQRHIEFVERDIERDPGAREAMLRAARAAGVSANGIPVIDFRGRIIAGFDRAALERAIAETRTPISSEASRLPARGPRRPGAKLSDLAHRRGGGSSDPVARIRF